MFQLFRNLKTSLGKKEKEKEKETTCQKWFSCFVKKPKENHIQREHPPPPPPPNRLLSSFFQDKDDCLLSPHHSFFFHDEKEKENNEIHLEVQKPKKTIWQSLYLFTHPRAWLNSYLKEFVQWKIHVWKQQLHYPLSLYVVAGFVSLTAAYAAYHYVLINVLFGPCLSNHSISHTQTNGNPSHRHG